MVRQNADIPLMFCGRLDGKQFDKHLILRTKHQPLNQRVHGSSPCAPTIEIKDCRACSWAGCVASADTAALRQTREEPAVPTLEEEDAERPSLVGESPRPVNRMKSALARLGIGGVKPQLRKTRQGLEAVRTPEDMPIPQNRLAEIRREMAWLAMLREQIKAIDQTRLERLQQAPRQGRMRWCLFWLASSGPASTTRTCWCGRFSPRTRQELAKNLPRTCGTNPSAGAGAVARYGYWLLLAG
jgi:hypothetical protein